jgi:hypothetical protein
MPDEVRIKAVAEALEVLHAKRYGAVPQTLQFEWDAARLVAAFDVLHARAHDAAQAERPSEELCDDEGCPHHGTAHVCITRVAPAMSEEEIVEECAIRAATRGSSVKWVNMSEYGRNIWRRRAREGIGDYRQLTPAGIDPDQVGAMLHSAKSYMDPYRWKDWRDDFAKRFSGYAALLDQKKDGR